MSMVMPVFHTYEYMYPRYLAYPQKAGQEQDRDRAATGQARRMHVSNTYIHTSVQYIFFKVDADFPGRMMIPM